MMNARRAWMGVAVAAMVVGCEPERNPDPVNLTAEEVGLTKGNGGTIGQYDFCNDGTCVGGEGDCDVDAHCQGVGGLLCGEDNAPRFGVNLTTLDMCWPSHCESGTLDGDEVAADRGGSCALCDKANGAGDKCSFYCPCVVGEGDCDTNADCAHGTVCGTNNGLFFGFFNEHDVCWYNGGAVRINEVDYDQYSNDTREFVELYNPGSASLNLNGYTVEFINNTGTVTATVTLGDVTLARQGYYVLKNANVTVPGTVGNVAIALNSLYNGAGAVRLKDATTAVVDTVAWEGSALRETAVAPTDPGGVNVGEAQRSIRRCPNGDDSDDNSRDFVYGTATAGASNACN